MNPNKRVGIYCRVSTNHGQTTENQLLDLRKYCESRGWSVVAECQENLSGSDPDRPQLRAVMELARKRKIDVLLVWHWDRFARSLSHLVNTLDELQRLGVEFVSYQQGIETISPQGKLIFSIMGALAEFERSLIISRVRAGIRRARAQGKRLGRPRAEVAIEKLEKLRQEGKSLRQAASELGVSKTTVAKLLSTNPFQNVG